MISGNLALISGRDGDGGGCVLLHVGVEHRPLREGGLTLGAHVRPQPAVGELKWENSQIFRFRFLDWSNFMMRRHNTSTIYSKAYV